MVIRSTSALEVSIHAVSPEFSGSGGGAAASALPPVARSAAVVAAAPSPIFFHCETRISLKLPWLMPDMVGNPLERVGIGLAGADPHHLVERCDEDFSVADLAGLGLAGDRFDHRLDELRFDRDFHLEL